MPQLRRGRVIGVLCFAAFPEPRADDRHREANDTTDQGETEAAAEDEAHGPELLVPIPRHRSYFVATGLLSVRSVAELWFQWDPLPLAVALSAQRDEGALAVPNLGGLVKQLASRGGLPKIRRGAAIIAFFFEPLPAAFVEGAFAGVHRRELLERQAELPQQTPEAKASVVAEVPGLAGREPARYFPCSAMASPTMICRSV